MSDRQTQQQRILARLLRGPASGMDFVLDCGVLNYGARIRELRKTHQITSSEQREGGKRVVTYRLEQKGQLSLLMDRLEEERKREKIQHCRRTE